MDNNYDTIFIGTGFSTSFFLYSYLKEAKPNERILVLEGGRYESFDTQINNRSPHGVNHKSLYVNTNPKKDWYFSPGFGGGSKAWWACAPRFMPNDFQLKTKYGIGRDWPISYDDLEPYYCDAEEIMEISGPDNSNLYPRSRPYPQPPHTLSDPDKILADAYPGLYMPQPSARSRIDSKTRQACCNMGVCSLCPSDSKFTILNGLQYIYNDPRITIQYESPVISIEYQNDNITSVIFIADGKQQSVKCNLLIMGAGSLFNPFILLNSGITHPMLGKRLHEQVSKYVTVDLDGVDNYSGSTSICGHGYMIYDGEHRKDNAACLIESYNVPQLNRIRSEKGKWRQRMVLKFIFEDLPRDNNFVRLSSKEKSKPEVIYTGHSDYAQKAIDKLPDLLPDLLKPLPVEKITIADKINISDGHILGTIVMGDDPQTSVVDKYLKHHQLRNLIVLGSCTYPVSSPANPALTLSALALWAAEHL